MNPEYRSYVLQFEDVKPFDRVEFRQASFLGEFVRPLVADQSRYVHYWSTYYVGFAKLRVYGAPNESFENELVTLRDKLKLKPLDQEKHMSLVGDLGGKRFFGEKSHSQPERRAFKMLASLRAVTDLAIDSVYKRDDGYWGFEENQDGPQNPIDGHLFSATHLYHNITAARGVVYAYNQPPNSGILSFYYFWDKVHKGELAAEPRDEKIIQL